MNHITDSTFKNVLMTTVDNTDIVVSSSNELFNTWRIKTKNGAFKAVVSSDNGLSIKAKFNELSYLYIRQILPNIYSFANKKLTLKIVLDNRTPNIRYDAYVSARFSKDDVDRVTIIDTEDTTLALCTSTITVPFTVMDTTTKPISYFDGLCITFRLIGANADVDCTIKSIELVEEVSNTVSDKVDACTLFPDRNWKECCAKHDIDYVEQKITRLESDRKLLACVKDKCKAVAYVMYLGVRCFGWWFWNKSKRSNSGN
jgi:hypothetical protein